MDLYYYSLALAGAFVYGFPSQKLVVIGITGTSGKSTTVEILSKILEESGLKTASLSSVRFKIDKKEKINMLKMTMPGRFAIQKFLRQAVNVGCKYAVLEITSEGIKQFRHKFIKFDVAVFTNLSPEHIESHCGYENYRKAKQKLFEATKNIHIINKDDNNADYFWKIPAVKKIGYSLKEDAFLLPKINLLGEFNSYNALAAIKTAMSLGVNMEVCQRVVEKFKGMPGRMEVVAKEPFIVIVDYAHTPEQLKQVYLTFKNQPKICVLGSCGGGRDKWKRPVLGKLAAQYCDEIIITNEDPYDEDPMEIINQVAEGASGRAIKILDRREAIKKALALAKSGDIVIITGKGCEPWMCVANGKKILWDDRQIVRDELAQKILK